MMYWFTADEHYNHTNIITKFVFRKFRDAEHMNREIIARHNSRVKNNHTVFHLGDFRVGGGPSSFELMSQLNGNHVFICGNHDKNNGTNSPIRFCVIESYGKKMLLTHRPEDAEMIMAGGGIDLALVGHVHEKWTFRENMVNVGVDQWDYYPIDARQILKAYNRFKQQ